MTITGRQAADLITDSSAVIIDDNFLTYASIEEVEGGANLDLNYTDEEGDELGMTVILWDDDEIEVSGNQLLLHSGGFPVYLTLLTSQDILKTLETA